VYVSTTNTTAPFNNHRSWSTKQTRGHSNPHGQSSGGYQQRNNNHHQQRNNHHHQQRNNSHHQQRNNDHRQQRNNSHHQHRNNHRQQRTRPKQQQQRQPPPLPFWTADPTKSVPLSGPPPHLILLVGMPGSGKSTFSSQLNPATWTVINQDTLKSRRACEEAVKKTYRRVGVPPTTPANICIDRCNFDPSQRKHWIVLAQQYNVATQDICAVVLDVPVATAIERVQKRRHHPTLKPGKESIGIVKKFQYLLQMPTLNEGIGSIVALRPTDEAVVMELVLDWLNDDDDEDEDEEEEEVEDEEEEEKEDGEGEKKVAEEEHQTKEQTEELSKEDECPVVEQLRHALLPAITENGK
jgi:hypothetical protein